MHKNDFRESVLSKKYFRRRPGRSFRPLLPRPKACTPSSFDANTPPLARFGIFASPVWRCCGSERELKHFTWI
jgi:hypothetical protein